MLAAGENRWEEDPAEEEAMRIKLDLEDVRFYTTREDTGEIRWMVVTLNGKSFYVQRRIDPYLAFKTPGRENAMDRLLVEHMEHILEGVFYAGVAATPDGPLG